MIKLPSVRVIAMIALLVLVVALLIWNPFKKSQSFSIQDKCGPIMNLVSHTVPDEDACRVQCLSLCNSRDLSYHSASFAQSEMGCNNCRCECA